MTEFALCSTFSRIVSLRRLHSGIDNPIQLGFRLGAVVPGAGAFELEAHVILKKTADEVKGRAKLGIKVVVK
jgi:chaperonin GroEL (HSP60 family)